LIPDPKFPGCVLTKQRYNAPVLLAEVKMKTPVFCLLTLLLVVFVPASAQKQSSFPPVPPPAMESALAIPRFPVHVNELPKPKVDTVQLQRDARELLDLSQSLQPDIEKVNQGLLPKEAIAKLKRIEKLSKRLRGELNP
jgi:hypothetical protein